MRIPKTRWIRSFGEAGSIPCLIPRPGRARGLFWKMYGRSLSAGTRFIFLGNEVRTIELKTGRMSTLDGPRPVKVSLAFDGRTLYYTTDWLMVETYDIETGEMGIISGLITEFEMLAMYHPLLLEVASVTAVKIAIGIVSRIWDEWDLTLRGQCSLTKLI